MSRARRYLLPPISRRRRSARLSLRSSAWLYYASGPTPVGKSSRLHECAANIQVYNYAVRWTHYHRNNPTSKQEPCWHWPTAFTFVAISRARIPTLVLLNERRDCSRARAPTCGEVPARLAQPPARRWTLAPAALLTKGTTLGHNPFQDIRGAWQRAVLTRQPRRPSRYFYTNRRDRTLRLAFCTKR